MQLNLHRGRGFISSLIKWQTRSVYSHVSITLDDGRVVEAREFKGVRVLPKLQPSKGERIDSFHIELSERQKEEIEHFLLSQVGKGYDYISILRFITRDHVPHWSKTKWFCSELAFEAFRTAGIELLCRIEAWAVSPGLLALSPVLPGIPARIHA